MIFSFPMPKRHITGLDDITYASKCVRSVRLVLFAVKGIIESTVKQQNHFYDIIIQLLCTVLFDSVSLYFDRHDCETSSSTL